MNTNFCASFCLLLFSVPCLSFGQEGRSLRTGTAFHNVLGAQMGLTDPWLGISYERLINPHWGVEAGVGLFGGSIGTKVYFPKLSDGKISLYTGISEGILLLIGARHYIPVGFTFLSSGGFRMNLDAGPQIFYDPNEERQLGVTLKLGKAF